MKVKNKLITVDYLNRSMLPEWEKTWNQTMLKKGKDGHDCIRAMRPFNPVSKFNYTGKNSTDLYLPLWEKSKTDANYIIDLRYATYRQIESCGGKIKDGAYPRLIKTTFSEKESTNNRHFIQREVFNFSDIAGERFHKKFEDYATRPFEFKIRSRRKGVKAATRLFKNLNVKMFEIKGIQPSFVPHENTIYTAAVEDYHSVECIFETLFHELVHWTKYNFPSCSRSFPYPQEELTAQIGATLLQQEFGLNVRDEVFDYMRSWLKSYPDELQDEIMTEAEDAAVKATNRIKSFI